MEVSAKVIVNSIEVSLEGKGRVTAIVAFKVGNMPDAYNSSARISVAITDELRKYVEDVVSVQVGEIITREEEVE